MRTRCFHSYCILAVATVSVGEVEGLSSRAHSHDVPYSSLHPPSQSQTIIPMGPMNPTTNRRQVFKSTKSAVLGAFCGWIIAPKISLAEEEKASDASFLVQGRVTVPADYAFSSPEDSTTNPALYVTCRPDRPDNVPRAVLDGSRGKAPPVLTARFENPSFPFDFQLTENDLTVEGRNDEDGIWWQRDPLIVSARLDMDGVAATRSPDDLVGRGLLANSSSTSKSVVEVALGGRGAFGKFATKK